MLAMSGLFLRRQGVPPFGARAAASFGATGYRSATATVCSAVTHDSCLRTLVLMVLVGVVHCLVVPGSATAQTRVAQERGGQNNGEAKIKRAPGVVRVPISKLPVSVIEMRDLILSAVERGDIEELRIALDWNELRPEVDVARDKDAIETWKKQSRDGKGLEILAVLGELLANDPARLPIGRDFENNHVFVWPYVSELELDKLTPEQEIELYRLVPPETAKSIVTTGKWTWYRLAIGADGTWHVFSKQP